MAARTFAFFSILAILSLTLAGTVVAQEEESRDIFCKRQDDVFAQDFDGLVFLVALGLFCFLVPWLLPMLLGYRGWWLTRPLARWAAIASVGTLAAAIAFVVLPALAARGMIPPALGLALYPGVSPEYAGCGTAEIESRGLLWGLVGRGRAAVIAGPVRMLLVFVAGAATWSLLYWLVSVLWLRWRGLPRQVGAALKGGS
ncbi:MAG: hypothetical protein IT158_01540 [Bryobacterales bacterium]|nr:hypothetical protein [Bryobacterales bacterium]